MRATTPVRQVPIGEAQAARVQTGRRKAARGGVARAGAIMLAVGWLQACAPAVPVGPPLVMAPPPISLPAELIAEASAFRGYMRRSSAISADFKDVAQINAGLAVGAAYRPDRLASGAAAYAAVLALQDPAFVATFRAYGANPDQRRKLAAQIIANPHYVTVFKGADSAAGLVIDGLDAEATALSAAGGRVNQAAYDLQRFDWAKTSATDRDQRLAEAKAAAERRADDDAADMAALRAAASGAQPLPVTPRTASGPYRPLVVQGLAMAALAAMGAPGADLAPMHAALIDPSSAMCLTIAKLNLHQCLSAAKPQYETAFCLGQHALADTGQCLAKSVMARSAEQAKAP